MSQTFLPSDFNSIAVAKYSDMLGSNAPTPGGGSAAGVVLNLSANCAAKAAVFSGIDENNEVKTFFGKCKKYAELSLQLAHDDEETFLLWKNARALPKDTDEEKQIRTDAVNNAVVKCISVPYTLAQKSVEFLKELSSFKPLCSKWLMSDLLVADSFAYAAFESALYNIDINMPYLKDEKLKSEINDFTQNSQSVVNDYRIKN